MPVQLHFPDLRQLSFLGGCLTALFFLATTQTKADGNRVPGGIAGVAAAEAQKRQRQTEAAQTLFTAGAKAYADQSYGEAMDYFKAAFETVPDVPAVADQRRVFFSRYQAAALRYAQILAEEARWADSERTLADVVALSEGTGAGETDPEIRKMLKELRDRDERYNQSASPRHLRNVDAVETKLIIAKGYLELGDYDRAERTYHEVLIIDPYSNAARRGFEKVERHRMDYYAAAYDHTRAKKLAEVAAGWETPVAPVLDGEGMAFVDDEVTTGGSALIGGKLKEIVIPTLEFSNATLGDVVDFLVQKAQELDASETDPGRRGVNILIDGAGMAEGDGIRNAPLSVRLTNVPLGVAISYAAEQVGMIYHTDNFAVRLVSPTAGGDTLVSRRFIVPPGFLSSGGAGGAAPAGPADPFADPQADAGGGALVERITAQEFLQNRGVEFGPGTSAAYIAATNSLIVRNTPQQVETIEGIVQAAKDSGTKMVQMHVKMISVEATQINQLGLDFLLGQSNLGSSPRVFFGGGTDGNASVPVSSGDFPINRPGSGPVGTFPVTSGLRTGDIATGQTIDDVINRESASPLGARAPAIFAVAGVFTDPQYQLVLRALSQAKGSDLLADTHVMAKPGQMARIEQVREFIYPTEYDPPEIPNQIAGLDVISTLPISIDAGSIPATPATPTAFETRKLGQSLEIEATVAADNKTVSLNVLMDFTEFSGFINYGTPIRDSGYIRGGQAAVITPNEILMPVFDAIKETTNVTVWDGQTVAIGGFHGESITATQDKVPYLGDLPLLGRAFRANTNQSTRRALTIFVTVRLVDPGGNPINLPPEEELPELMTRRDPLPGTSLPPGPFSGSVYPAK